MGIPSNLSRKFGTHFSLTHLKLDASAARRVNHNLFQLRADLIDTLALYKARGYTVITIVWMHAILSINKSLSFSFRDLLGEAQAVQHG